MCAEQRFDCVVISYDPLVSENYDKLNNTQFSIIRKLAYSGRVDGEHGGPGCYLVWIASFARGATTAALPPPLPLPPVLVVAVVVICTS